MKTILTAAAMTIGFVGAAWAADPIEGLWKTQPDGGVFYHVQMQSCGGSFCGKFKKKFVDGSEVSFAEVGKNAVFDMVPQGGGEYKGKAWRPSNGKTYSGAGTLKGNTLKIGGCVLGGLICSKQTWARLN